MRIACDSLLRHELVAWVVPFRIAEDTRTNAKKLCRFARATRIRHVGLCGRSLHLTITLRELRVLVRQRIRHQGSGLCRRVDAVRNAWASGLLLLSCAVGGLHAQTPSGIGSPPRSLPQRPPWSEIRMGLRQRWIRAGSDLGSRRNSGSES